MRERMTREERLERRCRKCRIWLVRSFYPAPPPNSQPSAQRSIPPHPHRRPAGTAGSGDPPNLAPSPKSPLILTMTTATSSNTTATQACAACKYQRRKCNPDCILAPYFPADQQRQFLNAHRLFGVSNIVKIIRHLDPVRRTEAMRSIIFQSNARAHDPVGGCCRIILELERQIERDSAELALVLRQLTMCRAQTQAALSPATTDLSVNPNLILSTGRWEKAGSLAAGWRGRKEMGSESILLKRRI